MGSRAWKDPSALVLGIQPKSGLDGIEPGASRIGYIKPGTTIYRDVWRRIFGEGTISAAQDRFDDSRGINTTTRAGPNDGLRSGGGKPDDDAWAFALARQLNDLGPQGREHQLGLLGKVGRCMMPRGE